MKLFNYIFLLSISLCTAFAGNSHIEGSITNSLNGEPLMGANVMLDGSMLGSASDEYGHYIIKNIPIGEYTLIAMFIGFENMEKEIWIEGDQEYIIDIKLKPSAIELQETKVTAEKRKEKVTGAPASIEIITSRDIKGKTTTNMGAYLKGLKGIDFTSSGINNYSISVRGFNSSFNTRLLTLSDGRVANIPALRVINYSTVPQSMDDVDKIEVILGPATALYGANAHSGVVNIISKPPSQSEGLSMSISGSNDALQLRKINGRFAKRLSNSISIKISGLYLHAYDWPYISEEEYKTHRYPWSLTPDRTRDGKDNNPWQNKNDSLQLREEVNNWGYDGLDNDNNGIIDDEQSKSVLIGNGEKMNTGDPDGDGVMGEDWYNGYDDDGDGLVDEDYFIANGLDDNNDGKIDENIDNTYDFGIDGVDNDNNGIIDDEAGGGYVQETIKTWGQNIENNILIVFGRKDTSINNKANPYYVPDLPSNNNGLDLLGDHRFNEDQVKLEFDIFNYDFGLDGLPGDPFIDRAGDNELQIGECIGSNGGFPSACDKGLDGIADTGDFGEKDGIWQPGDGWVDDGNGVVNFGLFGEPIQDTYLTPTIEDVGIWPPTNGIWDEGETIYDCGNDGFCWGDSNGDGLINDSDNSNDWIIGEPHYVQNLLGDSIWVYGPDPGENNGKRAYDFREIDGIFDTGDKIYGFSGEGWTECNYDLTICEGDVGWNVKMGNGRWNPGENFTDTNGDGRYTPPDLMDNYQTVLDRDGDGLSDYPDFEIDNRKVELRVDFDPNPDFNLTFQSGYSWTKTQQVTGVGRYIADGFEYKFYQIRSRYKNWFAQVYMNQSFSGKTRGYNLGNRILDKSTNYAAQIQNHFNSELLNTKFVWGTDYFQTAPYTNGTILNDGPNGYDNDGDNVFQAGDGIDNDGDQIYLESDCIDNGLPIKCDQDSNGDGCYCCCGDIGVDEPGEGIDDLICPDGQGEGFRQGKYWECGEGIDEPDEFIDPTSNEYGVYYQSTTELFGTSRHELITAARFDYHDILDEGLIFAPKIGYIYKPNSRSSMRFTYGKAHNTPNSITLFTDIFVGSLGNLNIYLRGNKDGTPYCRVGEPCLGNEVYSVVEPGFYSEDGNTFYQIGTNANPDLFDGYEEKVKGAPYFYKVQPTIQSLLAGDMVPLDTSLYLIFVPELNDDGVLYTPKESVALKNVEPIRTEKIQTVEFGYKGFLGDKTHVSLDAYISYYEDFFSPPTFITPLVINRKFDENGNDITTIDNLDVAGLMPINDIGTNPPLWNSLERPG